MQNTFFFLLNKSTYLFQNEIIPKEWLSFTKSVFDQLISYFWAFCLTYFFLGYCASLHFMSRTGFEEYFTSWSLTFYYDSIKMFSVLAESWSTKRAVSWTCDNLFLWSFCFFTSKAQARFQSPKNFWNSVGFMRRNTTLACWRLDKLWHYKYLAAILQV